MRVQWGGRELRWEMEKCGCKKPSGQGTVTCHLKEANCHWKHLEQPCQRNSSQKISMHSTM